MTSIEPIADSGLDRWLIFQAAGRRCACRVDLVREIVPMRQATRLPGTAGWVSGLVNLRGALVTVVDLAARIADGEAATDGVVLVAEVDGKTIGVRVDGVKDVVTLDMTQLEAVGADQSLGGLVTHLAYAGTVQVLVCDVGALARLVLAFQ